MNAIQSEETRAYQRAYYAAHREEKRAAAHKTYAAHREKRRTEGRAYYAANREKIIAQSREYRQEHKNELQTRRAAHPEVAQAQHLRRKYGLSLAEYDVMLAAQGGVCKICGGADPGGRSGRFHVDHMHDTGRIRGLLCAPCNQALGLLQENPIVLDSASRYLRGEGKATP